MLFSSIFSPLSILCYPYSLFVHQKPPLQVSKCRNCSKTRSDGCEKPTCFPTLSFISPPSTVQSSNLCNPPSLGQNPVSEFTGTRPTSSSVDPCSLGLLLQSCCTVTDVKIIQTLVVKCLEESVLYVYNNLICAYLRFGELRHARKVFDQMPDRNVVSWTAMINGYLRFGFEDEAFLLYIRFIENGGQANGKTLVCLFNLCGKTLDLQLGKQIHACVIKMNLRSLIVDTAIVCFYANCGDLSAAFCAFDQMPARDVVCWTTIIAACSQQGHEEEAISMFALMLSEKNFPNEFTVCSVLKACGGRKALRFGKQIHGVTVKNSFADDVFIGTSLVGMYAECWEILDARKVFNRMRNRNMVTWTSIIAGYARNGHGMEAINLFRIMKRQNVFGNNLTIVSILKACGLIGNLMMGMEVHAKSVKSCIQGDIHVGSTLIWFYCRCGKRQYASKVLKIMPIRDVVSWTAMISGCAQLGHEFEALELLRQMLDEGVEPNQFTYSSALKACAKLAAVMQGKLIHSYVNKSVALSNMFVGSALVNMYAKCGHVSDAIQVFDSMPERNLVSWKAMIVGYARNGLCQEALKLMYRMQAEGIKVDDHTLSTVLTACGNADWTKNLSSEKHIH